MTPHADVLPVFLTIPEGDRRGLLADAVGAVRWARDHAVAQAADATPGIYSPERRHSYRDPAVCLARGRDDAYEHAAACILDVLVTRLGLNPATVPAPNFPRPLSIWHTTREGSH